VPSHGITLYNIYSEVDLPMDPQIDEIWGINPLIPDINK
jgi:hypothetical protein